MPRIRQALTQVPDNEQGRTAQRNLRVQLMTNQQLLSQIAQDFNRLNRQYNIYRDTRPDALSPEQISNLPGFVTEVERFGRTLNITLRNIRANSIRVYNSLIGNMTGDEV